MQREELNTNDLLRMFGVTSMTVHNWRKGLSGRTLLPFHTRPRGIRLGVYFYKDEVEVWAAENNIKAVEVVHGRLVTPTLARVQLAPGA